MPKIKSGKGSAVIRFLIDVLPGITHFFVRYLAKELPAPKEVIPVKAANLEKKAARQQAAAATEAPAAGKAINEDYVRVGEPRSTGEFLLYVDRVADKLEEVERLNGIMERLSRTMAKAEIQDILENYTKPKKLLLVNFMAGLARGLGMTVGTAIVLALLGWTLSMFIDLPLIGEYIARITKYMKEYQH